MILKMRYLALIAAGMLMATHTVVEAQKVIAGPGAMSCGKFIAEDDWSSRAVFFTWAQGYLTGLNVKYFFDVSAPGSTDLQDTDGQEVWLLNYCRENPLDLYFGAVNNLWAALREQQGLERDSRIKPKD